MKILTSNDQNEILEKIANVVMVSQTIPIDLYKEYIDDLMDVVEIVGGYSGFDHFTDILAMKDKEKKEGEKMVDNSFQEVDFNTYCLLCKFKDDPEECYPCSECLESAVNEGTSRPVRFAEPE